PATLDPRTWTHTAAVLAGTTGEDQTAVRASGVHARRIVRATPGRTEAAWRARGTVLITGGTGGLGARVARWAAAHGADHLVLTSRRGPDAPGATELCAQIEELGARATVVACDVTDRAALTALAATLQDRGTPVRSIVHTAGIGQITPLKKIGTAELVEVLDAKVTGAANLDAVFADADLDAFVLFSSIAATWGSGGQAGYAAANTYLDALAEQRRARGLPATSLAWGPWAGGGLVTSDSEDMLARRGLPVMDPQYALTALGQAVAAHETSAAVADVAWDRFTPAFTALRRSPLLADLPDAQRTTEAPTGDPETTGASTGAGATAPAAALCERLASAAAEAVTSGATDGGDEARAEVLLELVRGETARVLGIANPAQIKPRRGFVEVGFDSLMAVELRNVLSEQTGLRLPATLIFDFPAPDDLVRHLGEQLAPQEPDRGSGHGGRHDLSHGEGRGQADESDALAEIDRLERVLDSLSPESTDSTGITRRLESLLSQWNATKGSPREDPEPGIDGLLEAATPDEMFELIQREFGKS
ncbi:SDR family NAD(P)-dependent oxidoreductase, partial [Streptomyces sp. NPDC050388]|uniref:type I polyketide synthase n=1 Tax=Streptomyces sp. NPDC050388 TaxID=3155781 RepID=UPI003421BF44